MKRQGRFANTPLLLLLFLCFSNDTVHSLTSSSSPAARTTTTVIVTGASGRTGRLVVEELLRHNQRRTTTTTTETTTATSTAATTEQDAVSLYEPVTVVRTTSAARRLLRQFPSLRLEQVVVVDLVDGRQALSKALSDALRTTNAADTKKLIMCSSAVPLLRKRSLLFALFRMPLRFLRRDKPVFPIMNQVRFKWKKDQTPYKVDYLAGLDQIAVSKELGVTQAVWVGSMGGTDEDNFLNTVGVDPATGEGGNILIHKREAEKSLIQSGLDYTILHAGGLTDDDSPRRREPEPGVNYVLDVNDELMKRKRRSIRRTDLAKLCVAALEVSGKHALDCIAHPANKDSPFVSPKEALESFIASGKAYDYQS